MNCDGDTTPGSSGQSKPSQLLGTPAQVRLGPLAPLCTRSFRTSLYEAQLIKDLLIQTLRVRVERKRGIQEEGHTPEYGGRLLKDMPHFIVCIITGRTILVVFEAIIFKELQWSLNNQFSSQVSSDAWFTCKHFRDISAVQLSRVGIINTNQ